jgi:AcrR family transcriptional regulator
MKSQNGKARATVSRAGSNVRKPKRKAQRAGRPTLEELERRKARVMQVATDLFVQHGYAATSLVDIAKAAGVATRTLYQHFGDKEAIFLEVVTARESGAVFPPPSMTECETLFEGLTAIARYICEVSFRPRSVDLMRVTIAESRRFPDFMMTLIEKTFAHFRSSVASMFDELAARKLAPAGDSEKSAQLFVDLILGANPLLVYAGWASSRPTEVELEEKVDLFILGRFGPAVAKRARTTKAPKDSAPGDEAPRKRPRAAKAAA